MRKRKSLTCPYCETKLSERKRLLNHIKKFHQDEPEILQECKNCHKGVPYEDKFGDFCSSRCSGEFRKKRNVIMVSPSKRYSFVNIDKYMDGLFKDGKYSCPHCETSFGKSAKLKTHIYTKHTEKTGVCYKCGGKNKTESPYCSRTCANSRKFSDESNMKKSLKNFGRTNDLKTKEELRKHIIEGLSKVHNGLYSYPNLQFKNTVSKINVECEKHGEFQIWYRNHKAGRGCYQCYIESIKDTQQELIQKFISTHGDMYDYSKVKYTNADTKVIINCKSCGQDFKQLPKNHTKGCGCPYCATGGFDKDKPGRVYYLKVVQGKRVLYKIGITNNTVKERFGSDMEYIRSLKEVVFENGALAYRLEQRILKKFKEFRYQGEWILKSGNTELFTKDVLGLDVDTSMVEIKYLNIKMTTINDKVKSESVG